MFIDLDRNGAGSLKKQVYDNLTKKMLQGSLKAHERLPSTRQLSKDLGIARNSLIEIYEQLVAEGYAYSVSGGGTYVAEGISIPSLLVPQSMAFHPFRQDVAGKEISFILGQPSREAFPAKNWLHYLKTYFLDMEEGVHNMPPSGGSKYLRQVMVTYLRKHKGIECEWDQVFITAGTTSSVGLLSRMLKTSYRDIYHEAYMLRSIPEIFLKEGYRTHALELDDKGALVGELRQVQHPVLLYLTPSHQMPLGSVMSIDRRRQFISSTLAMNHLILEDDYDSEFRYSGAPPNALFQLSEEGVIYLGTFSKTMGPGLRLGYMVVPRSLRLEVVGAMRREGMMVPSPSQYAMACLVEDGSYERRVYKMNKHYKKIRDYLCLTLKSNFRDHIEIKGDQSGLHIVVVFLKKTFGVEALDRLSAYDLEIDSLLAYREVDEGSRMTDTLLLGYAHLSQEEVTKGVKALLAWYQALT